ncbi:hypothetical protein MKX01_011714, partial [Papaver californicum]
VEELREKQPSSASGKVRKFGVTEGLLGVSIEDAGSRTSAVFMHIVRDSIWQETSIELGH